MGTGAGFFEVEQQGDTTMNAEFEVQKAGLAGMIWKTVCRGPEAKAREVYRRQLRLYSVGCFRLLDPDGRCVEEGRVRPLFSENPEPMLGLGM